MTSAGAGVDVKKKRAWISGPSGWDVTSMLLALTVFFACGGIPEIIEAFGRLDAVALALGGILFVPGVWFLSRPRA